ncbi:MAG: dihydropteroate synthase [Acidithiobacillales bacterium SG8_45]|nr:MAG: dihydropteroate synthase [Acidithiobacillales bacterium SG8_45]
MLTIGTLALELPAVMGILNVTPDSFSDGGRFTGRDAALRQAEAMARDGAAIIDVGGESTRPGAAHVSEQEELDRVIPVVEALVSAVDVPVSIDTSKAAVMRAAARAGAAMINDIRALRGDGALAAAVELQRPVCLMHMQGQPRSMQQAPEYGDVVADVGNFLAARLRACVAAGLAEDLLVVDPGFGFGKTPGHNVELLANLRQLRSLGRPILVGLSRKSTLGALTGRDVDERMPASIAAAVIAVIQGAHIVRAHDVGETVDALRVAAAVIDKDRDR